MSSILLQYPKNPKVKPKWREKRGTRSDFLTSIVAKHQKTEGDPLEKFFFFEKKSQCRKKTERGPFSLARYCMLLGKTVFGPVR